MKLIITMDHPLAEKGSPKRGGWSAEGAVSGVRLAAAWLVLALLTAGGHARAQKTETAGGHPQDRVVARVNGMPIHASDLNAMVKAQERVLQSLFGHDPARLRREMTEVERNALNGLIDFQLLEDEFFRLGGMISKEDIDADVMLSTLESFRGSREALMAELKAMDITYDKYREMREKMIIVTAVRARIASNVEVTDEMVREHYEKNLKRWRGPEAVKLHTLTILRTSPNARAMAEGLRARLVKGGDFADVAHEFSEDSRAESGGAWPWTKLSDIMDDVGRVIEQTNKGELSGVIEQPGGFIVLRVDDRKESDPLPFDLVKEAVKQSLIEELKREKIENRLCRLRETADIQRMGPV